MLQRVISVNVLLSDVDQNAGFTEREFPAVKEALDAGYTIKQVVPMNVSGSIFVINLTFILEKAE